MVLKNVDEDFQQIAARIRTACSKGPEFVDRAAAINEFLELLQLYEFVEIEESEGRTDGQLSFKAKPSFFMALKDGATVAKMNGRKVSRAVLNFIYTNLGYNFSPLEMLYAVQAIYLIIKQLDATPTSAEEHAQLIRPLAEDFERRFMFQGAFDAGKILNWIAGFEGARDDMAE